MTAVLFAAIAPFVLWPIETVFPYPHVIEELVKAALVFFVIKTWHQAAAAGLTFAFSESILYFPNFFLVGSLETFFTRLAITVPLHVATLLLIFFFKANKKAYLIPAVALAMILHYFFNSVIAVWPRI